jgi:hypothetical protein
MEYVHDLPGIRFVDGLPKLEEVYPEPPKMQKGNDIFLFLTGAGYFTLDIAISCIATVAAKKGSWGYISEGEFEKAASEGTGKIADISGIIDVLSDLRDVRLLELLKNKVDGLVYIKPSVELARTIVSSMCPSIK